MASQFMPDSNHHGLTCLPPEITLHILNYLSLHELLPCLRLSILFRSLTHTILLDRFSHRPTNAPPDVHSFDNGIDTLILSLLPHHDYIPTWQHCHSIHLHCSVVDRVRQILRFTPVEYLPEGTASFRINACPWQPTRATWSYPLPESSASSSLHSLFDYCTGQRRQRTDSLGFVTSAYTYHNPILDLLGSTGSSGACMSTKVEDGEQGQEENGSVEMQRHDPYSVFEIRHGTWKRKDHGGGDPWLAALGEDVVSLLPMVAMTCKSKNKDVSLPNDPGSRHHHSMHEPCGSKSSMNAQFVCLHHREHRDHSHQWDRQGQQDIHRAGTADLMVEYKSEVVLREPCVCCGGGGGSSDQRGEKEEMDVEVVFLGVEVSLEWIVHGLVASM